MVAIANVNNSKLLLHPFFLRVFENLKSQKSLCKYAIEMRKRATGYGQGKQNTR